MRLPPPSHSPASGWLPTGLAIAVPLLAASGCDAIRDSTGAGANGSSSDTVTAIVAATIGSTGVEGTDEYIFADVRSVAADEAGLIYVADRIPPSVRVYGPEGDFIAWVGREGEGPGEFPWLSDILADEGKLYVRGQRITVFTASGTSEYPDSVETTWRFPGYANTSSERARFRRWSPEGMGSSRYYDVIDYDGSYAGTVVVPVPLLADPPPFFGDSVIAGVVMDPATDVHSVVVVRFTLPSRDNP